MVGRIEILLFGVSNVGKSTTGELLANRLGFKFYDLDEEVKTRMGMTLETFVHTADLRWRDQNAGSKRNSAKEERETIPMRAGIVIRGREYHG